MVGFTRVDGRSFCDLRQFSVELNPLKSGPSCRITVGGSSSDGGSVDDCTAVMAVIYFSPDNKNRNAVGAYHRPTFEVYIRPKTGPVKGYIRAIECSLLKTLQDLVDSSALGKVLVSARIQVLVEGSGLLSACLNALITCALVSGLKLREVPHAVQFGVLRCNDSTGFIIDPTSDELREHCLAGITMLCSPQTGV
uniref:Putative rrp46 subunit of eukaryotic exosome n=1 Tax=Amblyomma aureolatum TaxID=187763 RepID=A0A1E1X0Z9_9ACAR